MAMEVMNSYGSYAAQYMAGNSTAIGTKKKDTEQTTDRARLEIHFHQQKAVKL